MMIIKKIEYLNEEFGEAYVTFIDNKLEIRCFMDESKPLKIKVNDKVKLNKLFFINVDSVFISNKKKCSIKYTNNKYSITCQMIDKVNGIGNLDSIKLHIGENLPGDLNNGDYIEFFSDRIDVFENDIEVL